MNQKTALRKTKIICTLGPRTSDIESIRELAIGGMNIARINLSHGDRNSHTQLIQLIKAVNEELAFPVAILLDTQGPEIRTGDLIKPVTLNSGEIIHLHVDRTQQSDSHSIFVNYPHIIEDLKTGSKITIDNGIINLTVIDKTDTRLLCQIIDGGVLHSRRHVNLPGVKVRLPAITEKDHSDILFGIDEEVDFVALSFVRSKENIYELKKIIHEKNSDLQVIAKIEDQEAVKNLVEIVSAADAVMVARGDLGVEIDFEELPIVQRKIIKECAYQGKPVIVATNLLESMTVNPTPTRAEITDVANAVYEEADAIMLSAETASGKYPFKCVEMMYRIACRIEKSGGVNFVSERMARSNREEILKSGAALADAIKSTAIIIITRRGTTALGMASFHPRFPLIYTFTNNSSVRRKLTLSRGIIPYQIEFSENPEITINNAMNRLKSDEVIKKSDEIVVISDIIAGEEKVQTIQVRKVL